MLCSMMLYFCILYVILNSVYEIRAMIPHTPTQHLPVTGNNKIIFPQHHSNGIVSHGAVQYNYNKKLLILKAHLC